VIGDGSQHFKYVQLKVSQSRKKTADGASKCVLQIIDVADKMLYGEVKAEQQFLSLINAAVSHELRNPLNSLIGQIEAMKGQLEGFDEIQLCIEKQH